MFLYWEYNCKGKENRYENNRYYMRLWYVAETVSALSWTGEGSEAAMHRFYCGFLSGQPVVCVQCGVCKINAALTAQIIAERITAQFTLAVIKGLSYAENV